MLTSLALFTKDVPQVAGDDVGPAQFFVGSFPLANLLVNAGLGGAALGDLTFFHLGAPDQVPETASLALLSIALVAIATFLPWQRRRLAA